MHLVAIVASGVMDSIGSLDKLFIASLALKQFQTHLAHILSASECGQSDFAPRSGALLSFCGQ